MNDLTSTVMVWYQLSSPLVDYSGLLAEVEHRPWRVVGKFDDWVAIREDRNLFHE